MNILERSIAAISPNWAARRAGSRVQLEEIRKYEAGAISPRTRGVDREIRSASAETQENLSHLRGFSRELERNDPTIKRAIEVLTSHTVGTGIRPAIISAKKADEAKAKVIWKKWAETTECDVEGLNNIYGIQELAAMTMFRDGEVLILIRTDNRKGATIPLKLQVLECDYLDNTKTTGLDTGNYIVQGVEFNSRGERVAYWLYDSHPTDSYFRPTSLGSSRISAKNVIHLFRQERAGQVRGVPAGVQAFIIANELKDYLDAQALKQKLSAAFIGFITTPEDTPCPPADSIGSRMQPGTLQYLKPGESMQFATPPSVDGLGDYARTMHLRIAAAYGITYESLTNDYGNVNFSSGRMGWVEQSRNIQRIQYRQVIPLLLDPIWAWFSIGIELSGVKLGKIEVSWTPPRREMLDPVKELEGIEKALRLGLTSEQEEIRSLGWNEEQLRQERLEDKAWNEANGMMPTSDQRYDPESRRIDSEDARAKLQFNSAKT